MGTTSKENTENIQAWQPVGLDDVLNFIGLKDLRTIVVLLSWMILIGVSIYSVLVMLPQSWVSANVDIVNIQRFFLFYPPLIIGTLLLFWLGFEWGFIPVFLSSFVIAFSANMPVYWALLFAFSFVLGLGIYALAYNCVPARIDLRDLKSVAIFVIVSLIAAMASSLGSFVWSLQQGISPAFTVKIWNGWWTGAFFQSILILAPILFLLTPKVIELRNKFLIPAPKHNVTIGWVYSAIASVVVVVSLFVIGGRVLGNQSINQALVNTDFMLAERVIQATESYELIFWISLGIILTVGLSGIYLVSSWNQILQTEVDEKTFALQTREKQLEEAVSEKDLLLQEIHGRVKNNLSIILALFELQLKRTGDDHLVDTIRDSKSRIRSISLIHELMSQAGTFRTLNLNSYVIKLSNRLNQDYRHAKNGTEINVNSEDLILDVERAVPVCMVINEVMSRVFEKSYQNNKTSTVNIDLYTDQKVFYVVVRESGNFPEIAFDWNHNEDLGIKLIRSLTKQIKGELLVDDRKNSLAIIFPSLLNAKPPSEYSSKEIGEKSEL